MYQEATTKPENYLEDLQALAELRNYLLKLIKIEEQVVDCITPQATPIKSSYKGCTRDARNLKVTIQNLDTLATAKQLYFVGFFGRKRTSVAATISMELSKIDADLTDELQNYPAILAYGYIELPDHFNYANLVIFDRWEDIERLKTSTNHQKAAWQVSPNYYDQIKIHSGVLAGGIASIFRLSRTNFYDFTNLDNKVVVRSEQYTQSVEAA